MSLPKNYEAELFEDKIYQAWEKSGAFQPREDVEEAFSIMMPPPNATGQLHLGHATMLAIQDIMIRFNRMQGKSTLWLPGTDHASIATQNKVETLLAAKGITRHDLGREAFLKEVEQYVEGSQDTIRNQVRKMGSSCDWSRENYTLSPKLTEAVQEIFIRMFNDGLIYRGDRVVNWCPRCSSTLADDEVEHKEVDATLYYMQYGPFVVASSRPETKLGDTAIAFNNKDKRFKDNANQMVEVFFGDHKITVKVIGDESIDPEFGSGALGVTPAHSFIDYELAKKHDVEVVQVINEAGEMTAVAGKYQGMKVTEARKKFVEELKELGLLLKEEPYKQNLSVCYRCDTPVEPLISKQWFIDVNKECVKWKGQKKSIKDIAISVVKDKEIQIQPSRFNKTYYNWMENLHDWCVSRQIWFGHRIPVWYKGDETKAQIESPGDGWNQDPDTLDTWFSSGLWTFSTLGWPESTHDLRKFHPTSVLETGYDILFFWIARMIIMTTYALEEIPFKQVYLHGLVRDKNGQKMSKSKGNGIDPLDMIAKYGTDAVRLSLVIGTSPGNDIRLYEEKIASYRNFVTKLWNISRFALMNINEADMPLSEPSNLQLADKWILSRTQEVIANVTKSLKTNKLSEAGTEIYSFLWSEFADWYLEISKVEKNEAVLYYVLSTILKLMHPFTPFVTEVIWDNLKQESDLISTDWPTVNKNFKHPLCQKEMERIIEVIKAIRSLKADFGLAAVKDVKVSIIDKDNLNYVKANLALIQSMAKVDNLDLIHEDQQFKNTAVYVVDSAITVYLHVDGKIDIEAEISKAKKEIDKLQGYQKGQEAKLSNKKFLNNAPDEAIEKARETLDNTLAKIEELQNRIKTLS